MNKNRFLLIAICLVTLTVSGQDKDGLVKEFNKVMAFSVQPYIYYKSITKMQAEPVMLPTDTVNAIGEFYKNETNIYSSNSQGEWYVQDSLFIQIDHLHKAIQVSKVDVTTKDKMNMLPLDNKKMQELFQKKYSIKKELVGQGSSRLSFEAAQYFDSVSSVIVNIGLQYSAKKLLPEFMEMKVKMKQWLSQDNMLELQNSGNEMNKLIQVIDDEKYLVRTQMVSISFQNIDNSKEKAAQMPSWKQKVGYNAASNEFSGKGDCEGYEITTTF